ncbi:MAG TPA: T9SS type A sorting domain-containing protein [Chitinophagales bacterium]|nr:T9SS type A sorting domain-containing protein [Chitinophagales bacterium]HAE13216.1 hypothetical protein [Bacteroidota bacterium]MCB9031591.1 T9SS type A sorting domain-containing protein [Chitinophagales bacterium]HAE35196.1 hypothetical protein [Bacteroidota bacterium]HPE98233.1 T9SS type A sorting domain-containing protein [Chitinophagales bacterium]
MKNLFTFLLTIATVSLFAQGSNTGTGGTTINPELENLGGFKPDINNFNPNNSGVFGPFGNADATEGPSHVANYTDRQESEGAGPRTLATVTYSLYPNPATDYVVIELSEKITGTLQLLNIVGQVIQSAPIDQSLIRLELRDVEPGVYFISIMSGDEKIVKQLKIQ